MHRLVRASFCATALLASASALPDSDGGPPRDRPERPLGCDLSLPNGCEMSCMSPAGETVFVHSGMQGVLITELAGNHALVELQYTNPADTVSVLVGDISRCAFKGVGDVELRPEALPPRAEPPAVAAPSTGGGGALSWPALLALALVAGIRRFGQVR
ncbi:MAG: GlyGly-CTERM sorting domain-containing protein [Steroidobacteraceae bacterium]|nr:GlyGly-CTERM sorting domain-containing protein [Steroidobacteraceae bacterium]